MGGTDCNGLGIIRAFGKRKIPVILLNINNYDVMRYSKYVTLRLKCPNTLECEDSLVNFLIKFGRHINEKIMFIPASDYEVLFLSKNKERLEQYYYIPTPSYEIVQNIVNKKKFYKMLEKMNFPHPKTYFPKDLDDLQRMGYEINYPFIIKPAYSFQFFQEFGKKNFVIHSYDELLWAVNKLRNKSLEIIVQELIPGRDIYMFYTYLNKQSEPIAICGYDKILQFPDDFGSGSYCRSRLRASPIKECIRLLREIKYHGFAEPELKKDPRDGVYKLLEINARTTTQNRLAAACGVDIEYLAYLDARGELNKNYSTFRENINWAADLTYILSCLRLQRQGQLKFKDMLRIIKTRKVHSIRDFDDPFPYIFYMFKLSLRTVNQKVKALTQSMRF